MKIGLMSHLSHTKHFISYLYLGLYGPICIPHIKYGDLYEVYILSNFNILLNGGCPSYNIVLVYCLNFIKHIRNSKLSIWKVLPDLDLAESVILTLHQ